MAKTCAGYDNTMPPDVLMAVRDYVKQHNPDPANRKYLDSDECCMLGDLTGKACDLPDCRFSRSEKRDVPSKIPL